MMLHIILLILKIIGILILVILGLILLAAAAILLSPAKYMAKASCDGTPEKFNGGVKLTWLFRLVSAQAVYRDGDLQWRLRIAWKRYGNGRKAEKEEKETPPKSEPETKQESRTTETETQVDQTSEIQAVENPEDSVQVKNVPAEKEENTLPEETAEKAEKEPVEEKAKQAEQEKKAPAKTEKKEKKKEKKEAPFSDRIQKKWNHLIEKIKYTFRKICDNIKVLIRKKEHIQEFLTDEIHKKAFSRALREVKRFLRFLRPKVFEGKIEFGFEDPALTGYVLAGISMIYPLIGEHTDIQPDFERKVLKGKLRIEGKVRLAYALVFAWNMFWDKNVRTTYRHIRKFKL